MFLFSTAFRAGCLFYNFEFITVKFACVIVYDVDVMGGAEIARPDKTSPENYCGVKISCF